MAARTKGKRRAPLMESDTEAALRRRGTELLGLILIALAVGLLLYAVTPLGPWSSFTLGFLVSVVFSLLVAAVLVTFGLGKFKQVKKPEATIAEAKATLDAVVDAVVARPAEKAVVVATEPTDAQLRRAFGPQ